MILTYLLKPFAPLGSIGHRTRFGASFSAEFQLCPCSFNSDSVSLRQVFLGRPLLLLPCGFYLRAIHDGCLIKSRRKCFFNRSFDHLFTVVVIV
jgi:DNA mismatch repair protein MutH